MVATLALLLLFGSVLLTRTVETLPANFDVKSVENQKQNIFTSKPAWNAESTSDFWLQHGKQFVLQQVPKSARPQRGIAKNIIFFLGSGMSLATLAATRIYNGDQAESLSFERFNHTGLAKTYALDRMVPDSASAATALLCGVKTRFGTIGVNGHVQRGDCKYAEKRKKKQADNYVDSIAKWALDAGKSVGFVTTTRVTEASTAALYAHTSERHWENDREVRRDCGANAKVEDIASQLLQGEVGRRLKVVFGGGRAEFSDAKLYSGGQRQDGRNLIDEFRNVDPGNVFIDSLAELAQVNASSTKRLLGLFSDNQLPYHHSRYRNVSLQHATLSQMTAKALEILQHDSPNGYFLFVVNGLIDVAHHGTHAKLALAETSELNKAVDIAYQSTDFEDTLMVVTADHSHTMSLAGYSNRSSDIFGTAPANASDDLPYLLLSYANGPGYSKYYNTASHERLNPANIITSSVDSVFPATVPLRWETHGGEDVPVYATGPWSHLFSGVYEQSTLPHLMAFAACLPGALPLGRNVHCAPQSIDKTNPKLRNPL